MIPQVGDDDYSCCKLRQTADKQRDNLECMQRNAWQHALHTLAKDKPSEQQICERVKFLQV